MKGDWRIRALLGPRRLSPRTRFRYCALTLVELLCVIAIIAILLALYLPAIARAFGHAKNSLFDE